MVSQMIAFAMKPICLAVERAVTALAGPEERLRAGGRQGMLKISRDVGSRAGAQGGQTGGGSRLPVAFVVLIRCS